MPDAFATRVKNCPRTPHSRRPCLADRWNPSAALDDSCWLCAPADLAKLEAEAVLRIVTWLGETTEARWGYLLAGEGAVGRVRPGLNELLVGTVSDLSRGDAGVGRGVNSLVALALVGRSFGHFECQFWRQKLGIQKKRARSWFSV
jgi:hypothetical protein